MTMRSMLISSVDQGNDDDDNDNNMRTIKTKYVNATTNIIVFFDHIFLWSHTQLSKFLADIHHHHAIKLLTVIVSLSLSPFLFISH